MPRLHQNPAPPIRHSFSTTSTAPRRSGHQSVLMQSRPIQRKSRLWSAFGKSRPAFLPPRRRTGHIWQQYRLRLRPKAKKLTTSTTLQPTSALRHSWRSSGLISSPSGSQTMMRQAPRVLPDHRVRSFHRGQRPRSQVRAHCGQISP